MSDFYSTRMGKSKKGIMKTPPPPIYPLPGKIHIDIIYPFEEKNYTVQIEIKYKEIIFKRRFHHGRISQ